MARVQAEKSKPAAQRVSLRLNGLRPGIGGADANAFVLDIADEDLRKVA